MVEVTRFNFEAVMPDVEQAIRSASFIALDAEFTGLTVDNNDNISLFDSMTERYKKLRTRASSFTISQIGISAFTKDKTKNSYQVKTFVFYIRPYLCGSTDKRFMCQASCLDFLCKHDFDFNKFIKEGIPFINNVEEKQLCKEVEEGSIVYLCDLLDREQDMLINDEFLGSIDQAKVNSRNENENSDSGNEGKRIVFPKDKVYPEYFQLSQIRNKYPSLWAYVEGDMVIVEEVSANRRLELEVSSNEEKEKVVNFFLGFTRVFRLLKDAQKPIVGHNFLMDLLLCFENFNQPLPDTYEVFKKELHSLFPVIYDTRHIWRHVRKCCNLRDIPRHCGLFELHEMFKRPPDSLTTLYLPSIEVPSGSKYIEGEFRHESGYDSYITGWVFLNICHVLAMKKVKSPIFIEPQSFKQHLNAVTPFINKVNISRSRYNFINLDGNDPPLNVPELLYIAGKNKEILNQSELSGIFSRYGTVEIKLMGSKKSGLISVAGIGSSRKCRLLACLVRHHTSC